MVNKMNIVSLFARSYVDAFSVAAGTLGAKAPAARMRRDALRRSAGKRALPDAAKTLSRAHDADARA